LLLLALHEPVRGEGAAAYAQLTTTANKTAINSYNSFVAKAMAALAKLAYCGTGPSSSVPYGTETSMKSAARKSCGTFCAKAGFSLGKVELVSATDNGQTSANFAYVAKLQSAGGKTPPADCALAIRGTWVNPANTNRNKNSTLVDWPMPSCKGRGCKVHAGAKAIWGEIKGGVVDSLKGLQCQSLIVTGHSLGGQLAALAMFSLQDEVGYNVELSYTFEGSTPFNRAAAAVFDGGLFKRPISLFRITHTSDNVVVFPRKADYMQPGSQVWFYGPGALDYVHCGTVAQAPKCGVNGLPSDTLCAMGSNPSWKRCGGVAPYGGPHCTHPIAPAQNFCNMAGSSKTNFVGSSVFTCSLGNTLHAQAQQPTVPPQIFPVASPVQETTIAPGSTTVNDLAGASFDATAPSCWKQGAAYAPLGMLGKVAVTRPTMLSCQRYCASTPFCEYASWWGLPDGSGWCHVSGGWAKQMPMVLAVSGPKDCLNPLPETIDINRAVSMEIEFLESLSGGNPANPLVRFNERGFWRAAAPGSFSTGSFVAFGLSMLVIGATAALVLSRAFSLRWIGKREATVALSSSTDFLETEEGLE